MQIIIKHVKGLMSVHKNGPKTAQNMLYYGEIKVELFEHNSATRTRQPLTQRTQYPWRSMVEATTRYGAAALQLGLGS